MTGSVVLTPYDIVQEAVAKFSELRNARTILRTGEVEYNSALLSSYGKRYDPDNLGDCKEPCDFIRGFEGVGLSSIEETTPSYKQGRKASQELGIDWLEFFDWETKNHYRVSREMMEFICKYGMHKPYLFRLWNLSEEPSYEFVVGECLSKDKEKGQLDPRSIEQAMGQLYTGRKGIERFLRAREKFLQSVPPDALIPMERELGVDVGRLRDEGYKGAFGAKDDDMIDSIIVYLRHLSQRVTDLVYSGNVFPVTENCSSQ